MMGNYYSELSKSDRAFEKLTRKLFTERNPSYGVYSVSYFKYQMEKCAMDIYKSIQIMNKSKGDS